MFKEFSKRAYDFELMIFIQSYQKLTYMLQGQKYEFVRKPRKLLSRDKQSGIASHHSNNRQISRDSL